MPMPMPVPELLGKGWTIPSFYEINRRKQFRQTIINETMNHRRIIGNSNGNDDSNDDDDTEMMNGNMKLKEESNFVKL